MFSVLILADSNNLNCFEIKMRSLCVVYGSCGELE